MRLNISRVICAAIALSGFVWAGCSGSQPEVPAPERVENHTLGIALATLPSPFAVTVNEGSRLELQTSAETGDATMFFEATAEVSGGINLVAEAESMEEWFQSQEGGQYFGNLELGTPIGPAFTARGSYSLAGVEVEELRVFAIHPVSNRLLRMTYRYPPGEGKERIQQLAEVLGEVEGLYSAGQEASSAESGN
jgi:hypothetical protein